MKTATASSGAILFSCDGDQSIGLGHVTRCLSLADELRRVHGRPAIFALGGGGVGQQVIEARGYPALIRGGSSRGQGAWLAKVALMHRAGVVVFDRRDAISLEPLLAMGPARPTLAVIDTAHACRLDADLAFYPPVPQVERLDWRGFSGRRFVGWDWVILGRAFGDGVPAQQGAAPDAPEVLVTMGGSDPAALTLRAALALDQIERPFETRLVLGRAFPHRGALDDLLARCDRSFTVLEDVEEMAPVMRRATLAVASFGVTAYELAALGVPAIHLSLTGDHAISASALADARMAISLGRHEDVTDAALAGAVTELLANDALRRQMSRAGAETVDGRGAARVAAVLVGASGAGSARGVDHV